MLAVNEIYNMHCIEGMIRLDDETIDMVITSPPYDNLRDYSYSDFTYNVFHLLVMHFYRVLKNGGVVVWVVADATVDGSETGTSFRQALEFIGSKFNLHDTMIYAKDGSPYPDKLRYNNTFEYMFVFSKGKPKTINLIRDKPNKHAGGKITGTDRQKNGALTKMYGINKRKVNEYGVRNNIWTIDCGYLKTTKDIEAYTHPAMFPEKLAEGHILTWSNPGDLILDPMIGSGTTAKMARLNDRKYIGFDISEEYCNMAKERVAKLHKM